jgi:hypothetical protein
VFGIHARNVIAGQGRYKPDTVPNLPVVDLRLCEYDKERRILKLASEYFGMPREFLKLTEFFVESHYSGRIVRFKAVDESDPLFDPDGWDGEQQIYRPCGNIPNVEYLVIYHQY